MLFFGHLGITLLIIFLAALALKKIVDYRLVLVGSLLPDLLDKPIGEYLFGSIFHNGRIFGHTIAFLIALAILAIIVAKTHRYWGIAILTVGATFHQIEDQMWLTAQTWLWPLFGWAFPTYSRGPSYLIYLLNNLLHSPDVYVPEIIGLIILAGFTIHFKLYRPENLKSFILTGHLPTAALVKPVPLAKQ